MLKTIIVTLALLTAAFAGFSFWVSRPVVEGQLGSFEPVIADPAEALTFARSNGALIWVTDHEGDAVRGFNLTRLFGAAATADFIKFVSTLDTSRLPDPASGGQRYPLDTLTMPMKYREPSIAAGTNFKEHADEIYSDDPPFLFPKLAAASQWNDPVPFVPRLDYEAELCMVPLDDIDSPEAIPDFALVLCNDFTDRWTLVTQMDLGQPLGLTGFAAGKGCKRCLPTGYLVVVPRSPDFYLTLELSLYLNGVLRQQFGMRDIILPIEDIVARAFATRDADFRMGEASVPLLPHGGIPRSTLILTGTAAGVLFRPVNIWNQGFYLREGDVVRTEGTFMGHLENRIVPADAAGTTPAGSGKVD